MKDPSNSFNKVRSVVYYRCRSSLHLLPLTHGVRSGFDGRFAFFVRWLKARSCRGVSISGEAMFFSASLHGGVGEREYLAELRLGNRRRWSSDTADGVPSSTTDDCLPTQLALWWPSPLRAVVPGVCSTSRWRLLAEYEAATLFFSEPSGDVPGAGEDGCTLHSWCDGSHRGPDCRFQLLSKVFSVNSRDLFAFYYFCKVLTINVPVPLY